MDAVMTAGLADGVQVSGAVRSRPLSSVIRRVSRQPSQDWQTWEPCVGAKGQASRSQGPMSMLVPLLSGNR